ncbi:putative bifunctional diguanylate cyclase/phosphodiesterase [Hydrogenimonas sp.]
MKRQIETLTILLNSTIEGIVVFNREKKAIRVNRVFANFFGYDEEEIIGMDAFDFVAPESRELVRQKIRIADQEPYEALMLRKDGSKFWAILRGKNVVLDGEPVRISSVFDISSLKEKEERILYLANHDYLTGTYNRRFFQEVLAQRIEGLKRERHYGALLFVDLDDFKEVNDTLGHDVGDAVLMEITSRIQSCTRKSDIMARIGGDEFVLLLNLETKRAQEAAIKAKMSAEKILEQIRHPLHIDGRDLRINASIGIAIIDEKATATDLMKFADIAMYQAKKSGKNCIVFFDKELQNSLESRIETIANLRKAIRDENFRLLFQKQIAVIDGANRTVGVEALVRWMHDGKEVSPAHFIPIAEESGLIVSIGNFVLREVGAILHRWSKDPEKRKCRISVNISPRQFEEETFVDRIEEVIQHFSIDPQNLRLEITENLLLNNIEESFEKIRQLKELGVTLSIDDFGTGFSSLMYLKKLPVDELKIDRSFIDDLDTNESDRIIVETIASLGHKFGLEIVAEGVENEKQLAIIKELGIGYVQGYYFGKPVPIEAL